MSFGFITGEKILWRKYYRSRKIFFFFFFFLSATVCPLLDVSRRKISVRKILPPPKKYSPWTARRTNASVFAEVNSPQWLLVVTYGRKHKFFGHIAGHDTMERLVFLAGLSCTGRPEGKLQRGRSPARWTDAATTLLGENFAAATRDAADRKNWKRTVQRVLQHPDG